MLSFIADGATAFAEALAARPAQEEPLAAARNALQISLRELSGGQGLPNYLSAMRLIDSTPTLLAAYLRHTHDQDHKVIEVLARREGVDPALALAVQRASWPQACSWPTSALCGIGAG